MTDSSTQINPRATLEHSLVAPQKKNTHVVTIWHINFTSRYVLKSTADGSAQKAKYAYSYQRYA